MLTSTFQLARDISPARERMLWRTGITRWPEFPSATAPAVAISRATDARLRVALDDAATALSQHDCQRLAPLLPSSEHWRLFPAFGDRAAFLDIETGDVHWGRAGISAIGIWDANGAHLWLAGRDLHRFPSLARQWSMLEMLNGLSFDVQVPRQAFPACRPPTGHIDLLPAPAHLGHPAGDAPSVRAL